MENWHTHGVYCAVHWYGSVECGVELVIPANAVFVPTFSGLAPSSRPDSHSTSDALTPTTPTSSSQNRLGGAPSVNIISGLASGPGIDHMKAGGLAGLLGPPPKAPRGRKKIKAENTSGPLLVVPYPILADQGCVTVAPKEGKTYRLDSESCSYCFQGFFSVLILQSKLTALRGLQAVIGIFLRELWEWEKRSILRL